MLVDENMQYINESATGNFSWTHLSDTVSKYAFYTRRTAKNENAKFIQTFTVTYHEVGSPIIATLSFSFRNGNTYEIYLVAQSDNSCSNDDKQEVFLPRVAGPITVT